MRVLLQLAAEELREPVLGDLPIHQRALPRQAVHQLDSIIQSVCIEGRRLPADVGLECKETFSPQVAAIPLPAVL